MNIKTPLVTGLARVMKNARLASEFTKDNLVRITDSKYSRWAVPSNTDPNTSMSFVFDAKNNIDKAFISRSDMNPDKSITSKVYNLQNQLMADVVHSPDGSVQIFRSGTSGTFGFWEWWDEFEYCVDKVVNPFPSVVANVVTGVVFQAVTYQMWLPAVGVVCAGVGLGRM